MKSRVMTVSTKAFEVVTLGGGGRFALRDTPDGSSTR
jgi:hypothetical protein